jgi:hypothetical protein
MVEYIEANEQPTRAEQLANALKSVDPMFAVVGPDIAERKTRHYMEVWRNLQAVAHHDAVELLRGLALAAEGWIHEIELAS